MIFEKRKHFKITLHRTQIAQFTSKHKSALWSIAWVAIWMGSGVFLRVPATFIIRSSTVSLVFTLVEYTNDLNHAPKTIVERIKVWQFRWPVIRTPRPIDWFGKFSLKKILTS